MRNFIIYNNCLNNFCPNTMFPEISPENVFEAPPESDSILLSYTQSTDPKSYEKKK